MAYMAQAAGVRTHAPDDLCDGEMGEMLANVTVDCSCRCKAVRNNDVHMWTCLKDNNEKMKGVSERSKARGVGVGFPRVGKVPRQGAPSHTSWVADG